MNMRSRNQCWSQRALQEIYREERRCERLERVLTSLASPAWGTIFHGWCARFRHVCPCHRPLCICMKCTLHCTMKCTTLEKQIISALEALRWARQRRSTRGAVERDHGHSVLEILRKLTMWVPRKFDSTYII
eukprot:363124-Chlamydomonas_euryale.AAC.1